MYINTKSISGEETYTPPLNGVAVLHDSQGGVFEVCTELLLPSTGGFAVDELGMLTVEVIL